MSPAQDINIIKEVYRQKTKENEKNRKRMLNKIFSVLEELRKEVSFEEAYMFGSVTVPYQFNESSDIDIAFKGLDKDRLFFVVGFLSRYLERDVNAMHIEYIHFKNKIIREGIKWKKG